MKKVIIFICFLIGMVSCEKKELIEPFEEKNWYFIEYHEDMDEVDQKIYDIYVKYGVAVFYKDTIGKEDRGWKDVNGNTNYYYEILKIGYDPLENIYIDYELPDVSTLEKKKELLPILDLLDNQLLSAIKSINIYLPCILLVDYMRHTYDDETNYLTKRSFNFMAIDKKQFHEDNTLINEYIYSFLIEFISNGLTPFLNEYYEFIYKSLSEVDVIEAYKANPFAKEFEIFSRYYGLHLGYLREQEKRLIDMENYLDQKKQLEELIAETEPNTIDYYLLLNELYILEQTISSTQNKINEYELIFRPYYEIYKKDLYNYGFLEFSPSLGDGRDYTPTKQEDIKMFFELIFESTSEEVSQTWQEYVYILAKYETMYDAMLKINVDIEYIRNILRP